MKSVAIIGGGITGLTAAFYLQRTGFTVTLFESGSRVGGAIQSLRHDGYLAEFGPNTILETSPRIGKLIRDLELESRRLAPAAGSEDRYVVRNKKPVKLPTKPWEFLTTSLFSAIAKLALLREPFLPAKRNGIEESIADFTLRRLGQEFLDYAIDPMVAGIYAGDPGKLSLQQAFPRLAALEVNHGSLIKGNILGAKERKSRDEVAKDRAPKFSFDEGLQVLPDTLERILSGAIKLNSSVASITQTKLGWKIQNSGNNEEEISLHDAVIYAGSAHTLGKIEFQLKDHQPLDLTSLSKIVHPPVASVVLGFRREDVKHCCRGFGALIPKVEGFNILGTIFSSSLFPHRAPEGHLALTSYVGGERQPELALLPEEELVNLTVRDLSRLFGITGKPTFRHCTLYPKAIPQYNLGYGKFRELLNMVENQTPNLFFAGQYRDGISLSDSIVSGANIAERVEKSLISEQSLRI